MNPSLIELGWTAFEADKLSALGPDPALAVGRIVGQHRREWDVRGASETVRAVLAGRRWGEGRFETLDIQPVVGDWVLYRAEPTQNGPPVVEHVLPRRTLLARGAAGRNGKGQVVAANIDWIAVVGAFVHDEAKESVQKRSLNARRMERYLTAIQSGGAKPLVILNKSDLTETGPKTQADLLARLPEVHVLLVSTKSGQGKLELQALLKPRETVGFVGLSGVGKSSLVNWLTGHEAQPTSAERHRDGRGRHTTTHRELFTTESGVLVIDTPGMREFSLSEADEGALSAFADIERWGQECRFADCSHLEEPDCRVLTALVEGELLLDRLENYRALRLEIQEKRRILRERGTSRPNVAGSPRKRQRPR